MKVGDLISFGNAYNESERFDYRLCLISDTAKEIIHISSDEDESQDGTHTYNGWDEDESQDSTHTNDGWDEDETQDSTHTNESSDEDECQNDVMQMTASSLVCSDK